MVIRNYGNHGSSGLTYGNGIMSGANKEDLAAGTDKDNLAAKSNQDSGVAGLKVKASALQKSELEKLKLASENVSADLDKLAKKRLMDVFFEALESSEQTEQAIQTKQTPHTLQTAQTASETEADLDFQKIAHYQELIKTGALPYMQSDPAARLKACEEIVSGMIGLMA